MATTVLRAARRPRGFVSARGSDAADFLQRMLSNDIEALAIGESCQALLLTPKGRVIAPLRVWRRGEEDFLLLTEPELASVVSAQLLRARFATKVEIASEAHRSTLVLGDVLPRAVPNDDYGEPGCELIDEDAPATEPISESGLELLRIEAGTPAWGKEIDERVLPAEAGLVERAVSLTKGCYPGQEPIARLHHRGHANRSLRVLRIEQGEMPDRAAEITFEGRPVGRLTSAAQRPGGGFTALAYIRREVPEDALLSLDGRKSQPATAAGSEG